MEPDPMKINAPTDLKAPTVNELVAMVTPHMIQGEPNPRETYDLSLKIVAELYRRRGSQFSMPDAIKRARIKGAIEEANTYCWYWLGVSHGMERGKCRS